MKRVLNPNQIATFFTPQVWQRGMRYAPERLQEIHIDETVEHITAKVLGTRPYKLDIRLSWDDKNRLRTLDSRCSCPYAYECKHAVLAVTQAAKTPADSSEEAEIKNLREWISDLDRTLSDKPESIPPSSQSIFYVLTTKSDFGKARYLIETWKVYVKKDGGLGRSERYFPSSYSLGYSTGTQIDHDILRLTRGDWSVDAGMPVEALALMARSGRLRMATLEGKALYPGDQRQGSIAWTGVDDDRLQLRVIVEPSAQVMLPTTPPWYADVVEGKIGPIRATVASSVLHSVLDAPPVRRSSMPLVGDQLLGLRRSGLPLPPDMSIDSAESDVKGVLRLQRRDYGGRLDLQFAYGDRLVGPGDGMALLVAQSEMRFVELARDESAENALLGELTATLEAPREDHENGCWSWSLDWSEVAHFVTRTAPDLREKGFVVEHDAELEFESIADHELLFEFDDLDNDWFSLSIRRNDQPLPLLPVLAEIARKTDIETLLENGVIVPLPEERLQVELSGPRLRQILNTLTELFDELGTDSREMRIPRSRAHQMIELDNRASAWKAISEDIRELATRLREGDMPRVEPPKGLQADLREYQTDTLGWLAFLRRHRFGALLADDMGLGKTLQVLAHLLSEKQAGRLFGPALVVAPTSLMSVWRGEARRFVPDLRVLVLHGKDRAEAFPSIPDADVVVTTYALVRLDEEIHREHRYSCLVLDEAQAIKNPASKTARVVKRLNAEHRICLTGTPMENHLDDLWSQFDFLIPGLLGGLKQFRRLFRKPVEVDRNEERLRQLTHRIRPFVLRRTKESVASELPPRTEVIQSITLSDEQADLYEIVRQSMEKRVREALQTLGLQRSSVTVLDALLKLRQVCCDPRLVKLESASSMTESAKLEALIEMLSELVEDGRRILVFSQFTSMLSLIEEALEKTHLTWVKLTGRTRDREAVIQSFREGAAPVFLISLKAGGTGLTLTEADTVIHYDPWWNPAVEQQATDRAHRIGQDKPVFVYKLIAEGTVEERIQALQERKSQLADALLSDNASGFKNLDEETLRELFAPLGMADAA